jgi:hypothetical protein
MPRQPRLYNADQRLGRLVKFYIRPWIPFGDRRSPEMGRRQPNWA